MDRDTSRDGLDQAVRRLETSIHDETSSRRSATRAAMAITATLALTFVFFFVLQFSHFRTQFTSGDLEQLVEQELRSFGPVAIQEVQALGKNLVPIYAQAGRAQLERMMPEVSASLQSEIDTFCAELLANTQRQLRETEMRVLTRAEAQLFESYPELHNPEQRAQLERRVQEITEEAVAVSIQEFYETFSRDIDQVRDTLLKFDLSDSQASKVDLQKKFLSLWLQLIEEEIARI